MWKKLSLRSRLIIIFLTIGLMATGIVMLLGAIVGVESITTEVNERLVTARNAKAFEIEQYFENLTSLVETVAESDYTGIALTDFTSGYQEINASDTINCSAALNDFYLDFIQNLSGRLQVRREVSAFYPQSSAACYLQYRYLVNNPYPPGEKDKLVADNDGTRYADAHAKYHPYFRDIQKRFGLYDVFLVEAGSQNVVYSVFKETDLGTSLSRGPYRNSNLADLVRKVERNADLNEAQFVDFMFYRPSFGQPAAFMGAPVYSGEDFVGTFVIQVPIDKIDNIMTYDGQWVENGLGETGEALLVGNDFLLRSSSRLYLEDSLAFTRIITDNTLDTELLTRLANNGPIMTIPLKGENVEDATVGKQGLTRLTGYLGREVLSAYTPLILPGGIRWNLVTEIEYEEAMKPVYRFQRLNFTALGFIIVLITILAMLITRSLIRPIDRLTAGAEAVSSGDTSVRVEKTADDEMGRLTEVFNSMVASIEEQKQQIGRQSEENDTLLFNRFPAAIAERFKNGEENIVDHFSGVTVLCCDIRGTDALTEMPAEEAWSIVQEISDRFADQAEKLGMEVITPMPDSYMAVCGMNIPRLDNGRRITIFAMELKKIVEELEQRYKSGFSCSIGIGHGHVLAGILKGETNNYMVWGPTVDEAQRLSGLPEANVIRGNKSLINMLEGNFLFEDEQAYTITGKNNFTAGVLRGRVADLKKEGKNV